MSSSRASGDARKEETDKFHKRQGYAKVRERACKDTGKAPIESIWTDMNKGIRNIQSEGHDWCPSWQRAPRTRITHVGSRRHWK
eukprot:20373-Pyramimonas_sp.AAC.1